MVGCFYGAPLWHQTCNALSCGMGQWQVASRPLFYHLWIMQWQNLVKDHYNNGTFSKILTILTFNLWACLGVRYDASFFCSEHFETELNLSIYWLCLNTLRLRQNNCHIADSILECIFCNENCCIFNQISLKFILNGPINNILALV